MSRLAFSYIKIKEKVESAMSAARNCRELWPDDAVIKIFTDDLTARAQEILSASGPKNEKPLTDELLRIESIRDNAFRAAVNYLESLALLPGHPNSAKAESLLERLSGSGLSFLSESYLAETTILNEHLAWLDKEENKTVATEIGFGPWIEAIRTTNSNFVKVLAERNLAREARPPRIDTLTPALDKSIKALWAYVDAHKGNDKASLVFADFFTAMANEKSRRTKKASPLSPES